MAKQKAVKTKKPPAKKTTPRTTEAERLDFIVGFTLSDEAVFYHDNLPGSHVALFHVDKHGEITQLSTRPDLFAFDDEKRCYAWGFVRPSHITEGDRFVFATCSRSAEGEATPAEDGYMEITTAPTIYTVLRLDGGDGAPYAIELTQ